MQGNETGANRGYFGLGVENVSKAMNLGSLFRTAHAFGASFAFTIAADYKLGAGRRSDTSDAPGQVPFYRFPTPESMILPQGCELVAIEITEDAVALPSFRHPRCAAYILGSERHGVSKDMLARCRHVVRIPTRFSVNLAVAGAIVLYDRLLTSGRFGERPVVPGGPVVPLEQHVHGGPIARLERFRVEGPKMEE